MVPIYVCQPYVLEGRSGLLLQTLPFLVSFSGFGVACFLVIVDAHLLTDCMALQIIRGL